MDALLLHLRSLEIPYARNAAAAQRAVEATQHTIQRYIRERNALAHGEQNARTRKRGITVRKHIRFLGTVLEADRLYARDALNNLTLLKDNIKLLTTSSK